MNETYWQQITLVFYLNLLQQSTEYSLYFSDTKQTTSKVNDILKRNSFNLHSPRRNTDFCTSICCTVRSRKVFSLRTLIRLLGPLQPMLVPSPPFSFTTTSLFRLSATLYGRPRVAILS